MSALTVATSIKAWLDPPAVPMLNTVYDFARTIATGQEIKGADRSGSGAVIWTWIPEQSESQAGVPDGQWRKVVYSTILQVLFLSSKPSPRDAQIDFAIFKEAVLARLRSSPTLGTAGTDNPIFMAGLGDFDNYGTPDLRFESDLPVQINGGSTMIWGKLSMTVNEFIQFDTVTA